MRDWNFCPRCGNRGALDTTEPSNPFFLCSNCGFRKYNNPLPSTVAVVERDGGFLLLRRAIEPALGQWDAVGGFLQPGETAEECVLRESREELGVAVSIRGVLGTFASTYGESGLTTIGIAFHCTIPASAQIVLSDENSEFAWFDADHLPEVAFKDVREALALAASR